MKKGVVLLIIGLILFLLAALLNIIEFVRDYKIEEFNTIAIKKFACYITICIILFIFYIKKVYFVAISLSMFIGFIVYLFIIVSKPHVDCFHNYIYKGSVEFKHNDLNSNYTIAIKDVGKILFDNQEIFPDSLSVFDKIIINYKFEIINPTFKKDSIAFYYPKVQVFNCFDSINSGQFLINANYFCDCNVDRRFIKRIEKYPIRIYRDGIAYIDTAVTLPINRVYDSIGYTVINFGNIKINNTP